MPVYEAQFCHWYAKETGSLPSQVPVDAVSVPPTTKEPEIVGGAVFVGPAANAVAARKSALTAAVARQTPTRAIQLTRRSLPRLPAFPRKSPTYMRAGAA